MEKFIITKLPIRTISTIDGNPLLENVEYDIALESLIVFTNDKPYKGEPFDSLIYKIKKDDLLSVNEGVIAINFETDKTASPTPTIISETIGLNETKIFSEIVSPQDSFDRIEIVSVSGKGSWTLSGNPLIPGTVIMWYNLIELLKFISDEGGSKNDYNILTWKYANIIQTFPDINTLIFNTVSLSKILLLETNEIEQEDDSLIKQFSFLFSIENGPENGAFLFDIDTTEFIDFATNPLNVFTLNQDNLGEVLFDTPLPLVTVSSIMNESGKANIECIVSIDKTYTIENKLKLSLTEVNSDPSLVDPLLNQINLIIPAP